MTNHSGDLRVRCGFFAFPFLACLVFGGWITAGPAATQTTYLREFGAGLFGGFDAISQVAPDGSYAVAGSTSIAGGDPNTLEDGLIVKLDAAGNVVWQKVLTPRIALLHVAAMPDGGFVALSLLRAVTARPGLPSLVKESPIVLRFDGSGNILWTRVYTGTGDDFQASPRKVLLLSNGDLAVVGGRGS